MTIAKALRVTIKLGSVQEIIFYNDYLSLKRCLDSVIDGVDIIFAVDGKFPNFPGDSQLSTDGSGELVKSYSKCLLINSPESEPEYKK